MENFNWVAMVVAVIGAGGLGATVREIASVVSLAKNGVSGREDRRRVDIIAQRDHALTQRAEAEAAERAADARADEERERRIAWQEEAARHRRRLIEHGINPDPSVLDESTENPTT